MDAELLRRLNEMEAEDEAIMRAVEDGWDAVFASRTVSDLLAAARSFEANEYASRLYPFVTEWRVSDVFGGVVSGRSENALWLAKDLVCVCVDAKTRAPEGEDTEIRVEALAYNGRPLSP